MDLKAFSNYCPVANTPILSKVLVRVMTTQLQAFLEDADADALGPIPVCFQTQVWEWICLDHVALTRSLLLPSTMVPSWTAYGRGVLEAVLSPGLVPEGSIE